MNDLRRDSGRGPNDDRNRTPRGPGGGPPGRRPQVPLPGGGRPFRTLAFWAFVALLSLVAFRMYQGNFMTPQRAEISYTRFIAEVEKGNIANLQIVENGVTGELKNEASLKVNDHQVPFKAFRTNIVGTGEELPDRVWKTNPGIEIDVRTPGFNWLGVLFSWLPLLLVIVFWLLMMRQVQGGGSAALKFGKTKARVMLESQPKVTFKDVAGCEEAKQELQEIIEFLKEPQKFQRLGGRIPKGALLLGPPGSGKTLLAKAVAGEAGVPFFSMSGSDFVEMFVGVGASRVRDLFEQGKRNAPCLTGDTVITLSGGRQVTIEEMFENAMVGVRVPSMSGDFGIEDATVVGITRKPCTDLFEVVTETGAIRSTGNHQFPVLRDGRLAWVRTDEIREGERIAAPRVVPTGLDVPSIADLLPEDARLQLRRGDHLIERTAAELRTSWPAGAHEICTIEWGGDRGPRSRVARAPVEMGEQLAYACGLIFADGYWSLVEGRSIGFYNTEPSLHELLRAIIQTNFGYEPPTYLERKDPSALLPQGRPAARLKDSYRTMINHRLIREILLNTQKRLLELPTPFIAAWLRGVFDGDGHVRFSTANPQVVLSAWKPEANALIRDALLRVGIPTSMPPSARDGRDGNIVVSGADAVRAFRRVLAAEHPAKDEALADLVGAIGVTGPSSSRFDAVPVGAALRSARESVGMGQRAFRHGHAVSAWERGLVTPSRTSLAAVVEEIDRWCRTHGSAETDEVRAVRQLADSAVLWTRVRKVTPVAPVEAVYDLCLDRNHNFIANRHFTHNCILFIDEIDAVGRHRGAGLGGGHDEREQTLNQLLVEMDGFDSNEGVIIIAATNRPDVLDPALLRPGRFDRQIVVDWPDVRGREGILKVHIRKVPLSEDVDLSLIARATPGMSGADLANMVNEAALLAARRNHKKVTQRDLEDAKDKVTLGTERKSLVMTQDERRATAYHEAGHALVAWLLPGSDPVDKVTIIPRGRALGLTSYVPAEERHARSKEDLLRTLCMMMGGRAAEHIVFNHFTTGASNDIERATGLARRMVCELGMSENLGPLTFGKKEEMVFLGKEIASHKDYSEQTAVLIDQEVRQMVEGSYNKAMQLLRDNLEKLNLLANTLLEREVLDGDEMNRLLRGETLEPLKKVEVEPATDAEAEKPAAQAEAPSQLDAFTPPASPRPAGA